MPLKKYFEEFSNNYLPKWVYQINPSIYSILNLIFAIFTGILFLNNLFILAFLFRILSNFSDSIDGVVARYNKIDSQRGNFIDAISDRLGEFFLLFCFLLSGTFNIYIIYILQVCVILIPLVHIQSIQRIGYPKQLLFETGGRNFGYLIVLAFFASNFNTKLINLILYFIFSLTLFSTIQIIRNAIAITDTFNFSRPMNPNQTTLDDDFYYDENYYSSGDIGT